MNKKILLGCILGTLVLMAVIIIIIINLNKDEEKNEFIIEENPPLTFVSNIRKAKSETTFITIENCINKYYNAISNKNSQIVYDLLSSNYKIKNKITIQNILNNEDKLENGFERFRIRDINYKELDLEKCQYYILGDLLEKDYKTKRTVYIIVNIDYINNVFSIEPTNTLINDDLEYFAAIEQLNDEEVFESIRANENNKMEYQPSLTTQEILDYYISDYKTMAMYYYEDAYNLLNKDYREKRFKSLEKYKKYLEQNIQILQNFKIASYNVEEKEDFIRYTIMDEQNNVYILDVESAMKYTVICDIHTLDLDNIMETYNESTEQEKVAINIHKLVSALNNRDYEYIYEKLADGFKENKYLNISVLENDFNSKLIGTYTTVFNDFYVEGNTYIYNITLNGSMNNSLEMQVIMQLIEGNDFIMSFNIKEVI